MSAEASCAPCAPGIAGDVTLSLHAVRNAPTHATASAFWIVLPFMIHLPIRVMVRAEADGGPSLRAQVVTFSVRSTRPSYFLGTENRPPARHDCPIGFADTLRA